MLHFYRKLIPTGICKMLLPQCGVDGRPELSCREDCDQIHRLCSKDIDRFYGALEFYVKQQQIDFSHLNIPTCTDFKYSYEYSKNDTCVFIGTMRKFYPSFYKIIFFQIYALLALVHGLRAPSDRGRLFRLGYSMFM